MGNNIERAYEEREFKVLIAQGTLLFASPFVLHFTLLKSLPEGRKVNRVRAEWEESFRMFPTLQMHREQETSSIQGMDITHSRAFLSAAVQLTCHDVMQYVRALSVVVR